MLYPSLGDTDWRTTVFPRHESKLRIQESIPKSRFNQSDDLTDNLGITSHFQSPVKQKIPIKINKYLQERNRLEKKTFEVNKFHDMNHEKSIQKQDRISHYIEMENKPFTRVENNSHNRFE